MTKTDDWKVWNAECNLRALIPRIKFLMPGATLRFEDGFLCIKIDNLSDSEKRFSFINVDHQIELDHAAMRTGKDTMNWVRRQLHRIACHEVDEALFLDGERWHDPHGLLSEAVLVRTRPIYQ